MLTDPIGRKKMKTDVDMFVDHNTLLHRHKEMGARAEELMKRIQYDVTAWGDFYGRQGEC